LSQIVTIKTGVRDAEAVLAACHRLGLPEFQQGQGTARLYEGEAEGLLIKLPGWPTCRWAGPRSLRAEERGGASGGRLAPSELDVGLGNLSYGSTVP